MPPTHAHHEQVALRLIAISLGQQLNAARKSVRRWGVLRDRYHASEWTLTLAALSFFHAVKFATPHLLRELAVTMHQELES